MSQKYQTANQQTVSPLQGEWIYQECRREEMKCEGSCEEHVGKVVTVHVVSERGFDWGEFNYCEEAIAEDERRGMTVEIVEKENANSR